MGFAESEQEAFASLEDDMDIVEMPYGGKVCTIIAAHFGIEPGEPLWMEKTLETMGGDSLDAVEIALDIEEELDIELVHEFGAGARVSEIIRLVSSKMKPAGVCPKCGRS